MRKTKKESIVFTFVALLKSEILSLALKVLWPLMKQRRGWNIGQPEET